MAISSGLPGMTSCAFESSSATKRLVNFSRFLCSRQAKSGGWSIWCSPASPSPMTYVTTHSSRRNYTYAPLPVPPSRSEARPPSPAGHHSR